jgi:hypothetical protein
MQQLLLVWQCCELRWQQCDSKLGQAAQHSDSVALLSSSLQQGQTAAAAAAD